MQTEIKKITDVEYDLEIIAAAADLATEIDESINKQKSRTTMKGFRAGKVPTAMVRKMYGKSLAYGIAEETVQRTFKAEILDNKNYDVLGQPVITDIEYEFEGDLKAVVRFGVRPTFGLENLSKAKVFRLVHEVTDVDVQKEIEILLGQHAELTTVDGPAKADSYVMVDMQRLDEKGKKPQGEVQKDVPFLLSDENLIPELKKAVTGMKVGKSAKVTFPGMKGHDDRHYEVTLTEVKRRDLPELDDEMVKKVTNDQVENAVALRSQIREQLISGWDQRSNELFQTDVIEKLIELHDFEVPNSVIEMYLEAFLKDAADKNKSKKLAPGFDVEGFKNSRRAQADSQARWMFIRDVIIADQAIEVTEDDHEAHFAKMAAQGGFGADMMKTYYKSMPQLMDQMEQGIVSEKVFAFLGENLKVIDKDKDAYEKEMKKG
ncbi:MAG: trigger factor [Bacteroidetes bacterium]|nr:trigger factor [Bacteroidota bacterium]